MLTVVVAAAFALAGCHRATEQDCEKILDRIVELELKDQGIQDPATVASRKADARAKRHDDLIKSCVGKRLPQSSLRCIEKAQSADEITEKCLR
jgi:hypothetical protein